MWYLVRSPSLNKKSRYIRSTDGGELYAKIIHVIETKILLGARPRVFFKESLIAFILTRIWRWTAATGVPVGLSQLLGPVPALPTIYIYMRSNSLPPRLSRLLLHDKSGHRLAPLLILPYHLALPTLPISHPRTSHQMCCILCCPSVAYATRFLAFSYFPQPLLLWSLVRDHVYQPLQSCWCPMNVCRCLWVYWESLFYTRWRGYLCFLSAQPHIYCPPRTTSSSWTTKLRI